MNDTKKDISEYEIYLSVPTLLSLQKPAEKRTHAEELLFQVVHQVEELWMKLALDDLDRAVAKMGADDVASALPLMHRVCETLRLMSHQFRLIETMTPHAYLAVRRGLGQGSGQESPGFNGILRKAPEVGKAMHGVFERAKTTMLAVHRAPEEHPLLLQLTEAMLELDEQFMHFRYLHVQLVKRIIGAGTPSLKGKASDLLAEGMKHRFFPALWEMRDELFAEWANAHPHGADYGYHG